MEKIFNSKKFVGKAISVMLVAVVVSAILVGFVGCNKSVSVDTNNVLKFYELKPETYEVKTDGDGNLSYVIVEGGERTVNYSIPTDEESIKELAYTLYAIGNKTMVTVPYASFYETGTNDSEFGTDDLPLGFETIDVRNNVDGYHFRQTKQFARTELNISGLFATIGSALSNDAKQWLVEAGQTNNAYIQTNIISRDGVFDWTEAKDNSEMNDERKAIALHPIPYTSSGKQGKINGLDATEPIAETGTYWQYDEETGYSIPYRTDKGGRTIGYERTDQHIFYSTGSDADKDGVDDYYNTIKEATVTYNAEEGYYEVNMKMDSEKEYTHIDTLWALRDDGGTKDSSATFNKLEVTFQLWDNGYFKQWEMWEDWSCKKAYGILPMSAEQHYISYFSYAKEDAVFESYLEESGLAIGNYDPDQGSGKGLSAGAIAGIVIGCVAGVAAIVLGVVFGLKAKRKKLQAKAEENNVDETNAEENLENGLADETASESEDVTEEQNDAE